MKLASTELSEEEAFCGTCVITTHPPCHWIEFNGADMSNLFKLHCTMGWLRSKIAQYQIQGAQNKMPLVKNPCLNTLKHYFQLKHNICDMYGSFIWNLVCGVFQFQIYEQWLFSWITMYSVSKLEFENWFSSNITKCVRVNSINQNFSEWKKY